MKRWAELTSVDLADIMTIIGKSDHEDKEILLSMICRFKMALEENKTYLALDIDLDENFKTTYKIKNKKLTC